MFVVILFICFGLLPFSIAWFIGRYKRIGFWGSLLLSILLTPFIGFLITSNSRLKNASGCNWCGNKDNEAEYCGLCGKNAAGESKQGFKVRV